MDTSIPNAWLTRARASAQVVENWREQAERERRLPSALFEALRDAHMFRLSTAKRFGGAEVDEITAMQVIEELARQDGSVGWNAMVASNTAMIASFLPEASLREMYRDDPSTVIAGALLPKGSAVATDQGFRLTGRWVMGSGCHQASWMVAASVITEHGGVRVGPDGQPEIRAFFLPRDQCEILDTWHTLGMRGTGSHDWRVCDVFVPTDRTFVVSIQNRPEPGALCVHDFASLGAARVAAVTLGIARDAIDSFIALAKSKVPTASTSTLALQHTMHDRVGRAEGLLRAGRALLYETVRALPYNWGWSNSLTDEERASIRLASAQAAQHASEAVNLMFAAAGTSGIYAGTRLDRCFRDIHVAAQHVNVTASNIEMAGQYLLGLGIQLRR